MFDFAFSAVDKFASEFETLERQVSSIRKPFHRVKNTLSSFGLPVRFIEFVTRTRKMEGGWSNDASDPGGATMFGLSTRANPTLAHKIANKSLTEPEAFKYIYQKYYLSLKNISDIDPRIGFLVFDSTFHGMKEVISTIQSAINEIKAAHLQVDGVWGPKTAGAVLGLDELELMYCLARVKTSSTNLAKSAARRVMVYQKRNGLKPYDYTVGFENRMVKRLKYSEEVKNV